MSELQNIYLGENVIARYVLWKLLIIVERDILFVSGGIYVMGGSNPPIDIDVIFIFV